MFLLGSKHFPTPTVFRFRCRCRNVTIGLRVIQPLPTSLISPPRPLYSSHTGLLTVP